MPANAGRSLTGLGVAMTRSRTAVAVDHELLWVVTIPEVAHGAARASSSEQLASFARQFEALARPVGDDDQIAAIVAGAVRSALTLLGEPPELPFIGEPFGGTGGTD
jgi:hypothetical protein